MLWRLSECVEKGPSLCQRCPSHPKDRKITIKPLPAPSLSCVWLVYKLAETVAVGMSRA